MEENRMSLTALFTAYFRGYHAAHDEPKVFDDFLAFRLLTAEERAAVEDSFLTGLRSADPVRAASFPDRESALRSMMQRICSLPIVLGRARYTEDRLGEAVREGVRQYVILGAGMDTFAFRRPELAENLRVFEVDHPAMHSFKRRRLAELGWELPAHLHFVSVDFTRESLTAALSRTPYDPQAPTFFSWQGVTYYLPREAVFATFRAIATIAPAGSVVVFDYLDTEAFVPEKAAPRVHYMLRAVAGLGEPMLTGLDPLTLPAELAPLGLRVREDLSPLNVQERYFMGRTDEHRASEHAHYACLVVEESA